jgi:hypothetical protein
MKKDDPFFVFLRVKDTDELKNLLTNKYVITKKLLNKMNYKSAEAIHFLAEEYCENNCGNSLNPLITCYNCKIWEVKNKALNLIKK